MAITAGGAFGDSNGTERLGRSGYAVGRGDLEGDCTTAAEEEEEEGEGSRTCLSFGDASTSVFVPLLEALESALLE